MTKRDTPPKVAASFDRNLWHHSVGSSGAAVRPGGGGVARPARNVLKTPAGFPPKVGFDTQAWKPNDGQDPEAAEAPKLD